MIHATGSPRFWGATATIVARAVAAIACAGAVAAGCSLVNDPGPSLVPTGGGASQGGGGGGSACTAETVAQACGTNSECREFSCESGSCKAVFADKNVACNDAPGDEVCDGNGECVPPSCTDGAHNGKETDVDCGGACDPCGNGKLCAGSADCLSGNCPGDDGVCCDIGCNGACEACLGAKTGSGLDGACLPVAADTDPDDECAASDADCQTGECGGVAGSCKPAPSATGCRASVGDCDVSESCDGATAVCPKDAFAPEGQICNTTGACDGLGGGTVNCLPGAVQVVAGGSATCARFISGQVKCWGDNFFGQLGQGDTAFRGDGPNELGDNLPAVPLGAGRTAVSIAAGAGHVCALLDDKTVKCWGLNDSGQLGLGDTNHRGDAAGEMGDKLPAVALGAGKTAIALDAGGTRTCALLNDDTVKCWGNNSYGRLGLGDTNHRGDGPNEMGDFLQLVPLGAGRTAKAIDAGNDHACALLDNATVKCWGRNQFGQLGLGNTLSRGDNANEMGDSLPPVPLGTGLTGMAIATGLDHSCALLDDATVKCWGANYSGQLGLGDAKDRGDQGSELGDKLPPVQP